MSDYDVESVARALRDSRSGRATPMTDEEWERVKELFPTSYRILMADAKRMIEDGEMDE